ncbi:hypothetical protein JAAARDRAFT_108107, partial [Jaapia argillacea MUCL 33604]
DVDIIAHCIAGSNTSKKYSHNEIWSLIAYRGAPNWFITFTPGEISHPISLYYALTKQKILISVPIKDECRKLLIQNPVAGVQFFHFAVNLFLQHILGVNSDHLGVYGKTGSSYGTIEQ